ncbi:hydrogenase maturation protease [Candidatus Manganitrophus noduliformans]|uniref:Hydrogenase maturation protease n=1 Tax=Candidatus Manganitrophus noduliformans TaxID=2606439 RepID=A0A7X6DTV4_9BACT|nr:hydrogenase maturation protease [Candidatus Manganitrophus noduliformans]NKE73287.1 hydrogenase maturation protease [Candidatus Manganitrophus noduliformans]
MENRLSKIFVVGIGNDYRWDDAAGRIVARRLKTGAPLSTEIFEETGEGTSLLEAWRGAEDVFLIDAVQSGAPPGTVHRIDVSTQPLPASLFRHSTHAFGIAEAVELARVLHQLPPRLIIYGIEGERFDAGVGLSPAVEKAVAEVEARLREEIIKKG